MDKIVNVELLGHPVNWLIIALALGLWFFGAFAVFGVAGPASAPKAS